MVIGTGCLIASVAGFVIVPEHAPGHRRTHTVRPVNARDLMKRSYCPGTNPAHIVPRDYPCPGSILAIGLSRPLYVVLQIATWTLLIVGAVLLLRLLMGLGKVEWLSPIGIAGVLILVAIVAGAVYARGWAQTWMPNVVVGALTVALTITVIDRAVRREAQRRIQPHQDDVLRSIGDDFELLLSRVAFDYGDNPGTEFKNVPAEPLAIFDLWMSAQTGNGAKNKPDWFPAVADGGKNFAERLERHRERDRDVIPADLIRAIDRFQREMEMAETGARALLEDRKYQGIAHQSEGQTVEAARAWFDVFTEFAPEPPRLADRFREITEDVARRQIEARHTPRPPERQPHPPKD